MTGRGWCKKWSGLRIRTTDGGYPGRRGGCNEGRAFARLTVDARDDGGMGEAADSPIPSRRADAGGRRWGTPETSDGGVDEAGDSQN